MTGLNRDNVELRVLVLAPMGKDAALTQALLERAEIAGVCCNDLEDVCAHLRIGVGALLIAEEALGQAPSNCLTEWLAGQSAWSDLPILLLSRSGANSAAIRRGLEQLGNVVVLERPTRIAALVSAVQTALRARRRQYQIRDYIAEQEHSHQAKAFLAAIVASSDDAIISKTLDGHILTWNAGAERLFGYTAAEAIGQPITLLIPPERADEEPALLARLRRGERIEHFETIRITKSGQRLDVSLTVSPVRDAEGRVIAASKVARDISQSKRAAAKLRAAQEDLRVVTDNMAVAVTRCSRDLRYLWVSPGCAAWLGRSAEEIIGRSIADILGPAAFAIVRPRIERVLSGERVEFEELIPYQHMAPRWVKVVYVPTQDLAGRTDGWVAVITDTTQHHQMQEALREADRRKDEFLAVLAHELRNPLAPIRNSLHILRLHDRDEPTSERVIEMMERQVNHMVRLVDDLLEVSRITRGKIELRKELLEIVAVVRGAVEASRPLIDEAHHDLAIAIPPEALVLEGDIVRLTQVVSNLLNNAAKYTDAGGNIWLTARRDGDSAVISVRDTGTGIPPEMLPRVFELFTQINRKIDRQGGLGIGLALVKNLVELHGGSVEAKSEGLGRGSEFVVRLPLAKAQGLPQDSPAPRLGHVLGPSRVLVVDDNRDAAESLSTLLRLLGADVHTAYNGPDALDVLPTFRPTVVLLDIGMPGMDGHEVARRIRQQHEFRDVTLIALTGWGQDEDRRRSESAGFDHHLIKPADVDALQTLLISLEGRRPL